MMTRMITWRGAKTARAHAQVYFEKLCKQAASAPGVERPYLPLINPNHGLLVALHNRAEGTYYHSIVVGSMAGAAAFRAGGDADLARAIGYFHDVGKLRKRKLYAESRSGTRLMSPAVTREGLAEILNHPRASREILDYFGFPPEIFTAVEQHHGARLSYAKLKEDVLPGQRHYPGPFPDTLESAIVMFADSVQALVEKKSHDRHWDPYPSREKIQGMIEGHGCLVRAEGQFDQSPLDESLQAKVEGSFTWWLFRFYNGFKVSGTPYAEDKEVIASKSPHKGKIRSRDSQPRRRNERRLI